MNIGAIYALAGLAVAIVAAALLLVRRAGRQPVVGQDPRAIVAAGLQARKRLLVLIVLVLAGIGAVFGFLWPRNDSGEPINTVTSRLS
jgi:predicted exporter